MSTNVSLRGRDAFILKLITRLKPEVSAARVSLPASPRAITTQLLGMLETIVAEVQTEPRIAILPGDDDVLLAARWVLCTEELERG